MTALRSQLWEMLSTCNCEQSVQPGVFSFQEVEASVPSQLRRCMNELEEYARCKAIEEAGMSHVGYCYISMHICLLLEKMQAQIHFLR